MMRYKVIETGGRVVFESDDLAESQGFLNAWPIGAFLLDCQKAAVCSRNDC